MKLLGCGLIFLCAAMVGILRKAKLDENTAQWQRMCDFLQLVREELQNSRKPSGEILESLRQSCGDFSFLWDYFSAEGTVQQRLLHAAEQLSDPKLKTVALRFAGRFGAASFEVQLEAISALEQLCQSQYQHSREQSLKEGPLSVTLGLLAGAAAAILLI